jgi:cellobiose phosphorylase
MKLTKINLDNFGKFKEDIGSFEINNFYLPSSWPYLLTNENISLRCDQFGLDSIQINPPGGNFLLKRSAEQQYSPLLLWISESGYPCKAFTNFFKPILKPDSAAQSPQDFSLNYKPWLIEYFVRENDIECRTKIHLVEKSPAARISFSIKNVSDRKRELNLALAFQPYCWNNIAAPWDVPHLYQKIDALNNPKGAFVIKCLSPAGKIEEREDYFCFIDMKNIHRRTVLHEDFIGTGTFYSPQSIWEPENIKKEIPLSNSCRKGLISASSKITLEPNSEYSFNAVIGYLGRNIELDAAEKNINKNYSHYESTVTGKDFSAHKSHIENVTSLRHIETEDESLNRYVNEYAPMQLDWISYLDRGWGSGLRGVRDCAQDFTALIEIQPARVRNIILEIFSLQKTDGSFLRQYNVLDRNGKHDERHYVDSGLWVWELIYDYISSRQDFDLLNAKLPYYGQNTNETVFEHITKLFQYFIKPENIGPHGLCKIYNGDWNDSINKAGLEGKGETIMVSTHLAAAIKDFLQLLNHLKSFSQYKEKQINNLETQFKIENEKLIKNLINHAYNQAGFFNGVYTDADQWIFSDSDPDGVSRVNCPVNCFGLIAGILEQQKAEEVVKNLKSLRCNHGYKLFSPAFGNTQIQKLGRLGSGDLLEGFAENATVYNHGTNGFLGRAAAVYGDGNLLYDTLNCMYPYNQQIHPVQTTKTAPYAIVNHWRTAKDVDGNGGDCFFTGSLSVGLRNVYRGMVGFRPALEGITIDPVIPTDWKGLKAKCTANDIEFDIEIINQTGQGSLVKELFCNDKKIDSFLQESYRKVGFINYSLLTTNKNNIQVTL